MLESIDTKDYMTERPVTFKKDASLFDVIQIIVDNRLSGATVLDDERRVIGVISEMDLLKAMIHVSYFHEGGGTIGDYMTSACETLDPNVNLVDAAQQLMDSKHRRMPLVDDAGKFVGQISARSILRAFLESMRRRAATNKKKT
ncbi:MAG: CBS domain-containing protein [Gammaproteobacteria bacterium]